MFNPILGGFMQLIEIEKALLPTPWEIFLYLVLKKRKTEKNHIALVYGDIKKVLLFFLEYIQNV